MEYEGNCPRGNFCRGQLAQGTLTEELLRGGQSTWGGEVIDLKTSVAGAIS